MNFNHIIDSNRALEGFSWSFDKNNLVLSEIRENENSMNVNLNWCDFFVHIHDLLLSMMNLGVATLIGNLLGRFRDLEIDESGYLWWSTL